MSDIKALVLAAGKGTRMKSERPKVLFEANGLPLVWYSVTAARKAAAGEVLVVVGTDGQVQKAFEGEELTWVVQERRLGTGHAVLSARDALGSFDGLLFVLCGDAPLVSAETLAALAARTAETAAAASVLTAVVNDPTGYGRIVRGQSGIAAIVEEKCANEAEKAIKEINSGTYCFRWRELDGVLDRLSDDNPQGEYLLTDAVALLMEDKKRVEAVPAETAEEALGVNTRAQLAAVSKALRMRTLDRLMADGVTIVDPDTAFIDPRAEIGVDTVINPFVVIEGAVKIGAGCAIGPFTRIRGASAVADGVQLGNFVEVARSTFGRGSRARHLAFVGDGKIGEEANIAAGVATANSDGKAWYTTEIGDGASIGAGTVLVAPCSVAPGGATGAGAVLTRGKRVGEGETWVGVPAKKLLGGGENDG